MSSCGITLGPRDIQQIDLAQALAARGVLSPLDDAGVDIIYSGPPGTVIGRLTSLDQTRDFSFDVPVKDPLTGTNRVNGDYPWRLDNGFKTVVHIKNVLDAPVQAEVQIRYDGGTYNPELIPLQPHQTIDLDIRAMRDAQQPDLRGSVMPKDVVSGQLLWVEMTPGSLIGRAEVSNIGQGIASSFSCSGPSNCSNSLFSTALNPASVMMLVGDSNRPFIALETDQNCLGDHFGPNPASAIITWSSSNTSVATVDQTGNVTAVGPGTATISAQWQAVVYECGNFCTQVNANPVATASVSVDAPTYFRASSVTKTDFGTCTGGAAFAAKVVYKVYDANGMQIVRDGMTAQELVTVTDDNGDTISKGTSYQAFATPPQTGSDGIVNDIPVGTCITPAPPPNRCFNVTQLFNIVVPNAGGSGSTTFDIKTITIRRDCQQGIRISVTNTGSQDEEFSLGTVN